MVKHLLNKNSVKYPVIIFEDSSRVNGVNVAVYTPVELRSRLEHFMEDHIKDLKDHGVRFATLYVVAVNKTSAYYEGLKIAKKVLALVPVSK